MGIKDQLIITGSGGFIGYEFLNKSTVINNFNLIICNKIFDLDILLTKHPQSTVIHLAGKFSGSEKELWDSNVEFTRKILKSLTKMNSGRLIYLSTGAVYGQKLCDAAAKETDIIKPTNFYGVTKAVSELLIQNFVAKTNNKFYILRLPNVYGGSQKKGVVYNFTQQIKEKNELQITGNGEHLRDFLHINDLIKAIDLAIKYNKNSDILNISSNLSLNIDQVADIISNKDSKRKYLPHNNHLEKLVLDYSKAKKILGYKPEINDLLIN